jgi:hypothetical protein
MTDRAQDRDRLYKLVERGSACHGGAGVLGDSQLRRLWPRAGIYFFYEDGEVRPGGEPRIVRVGTHGLRSTSRSTLPGRLAQHRGSIAGSNPGGGNHRGSIFRLHVGSALIRRSGGPDELLRSWLGAKADPRWRSAELGIERRVSTVIGKMTVRAIRVPTRDDGSSDRGYIERNAIALLSCLAGPAEPPSRGWLGHDSNSPKVRLSGLWNVNHVDETYDPTFLTVLGDHANG